jgi:FHA domain
MTHEDEQGVPGGPYLQGLVGSLTGRRLALAGRQVLGRDATQCQLVLGQAVVSRRHAEIEVGDDGRVTVTDFGSSEGTFVNGERVGRRELRDGDRFGPDGIVAFAFHDTHGPPPAAPACSAAAPRAEALRARLIAAARVASGAGSVGREGRGVERGASRAGERDARHLGERAAAPPRPSEKGLLRIGRAPDNDRLRARRGGEGQARRADGRAARPRREVGGPGRGARRRRPDDRALVNRGARARRQRLRPEGAR